MNSHGIEKDLSILEAGISFSQFFTKPLKVYFV